MLSTLTLSQTRYDQLQGLQSIHHGSRILWSLELCHLSQQQQKLLGCGYDISNPENINWLRMENIHPNLLNRCPRVPTVVSGAFYYRLDVCNLCKLLQTQFLSNYPTIILFYLYNNIPQVNNKCIISCNHLLTYY